MSARIKKAKDLWKRSGRIKWVGLGVLVLVAAISLFLMMRGVIFAPKEIVIGSVGVRIYSLTMLFGLVTSIAIFNILKRKEKGLDKLDVWDGALYAIIPGIIGARIYHVLTDFYLYQDNLIGVFQLWNGGLGFIGGILGGMLGLVWYLRRKKVSIQKVFGILVIAVPVGQAVGRLGNFFNRELFGVPADLPWSVYIDPALNPFPALRSYSYFHPLFLYEAVANLILAAILYGWWRKGYPGSTLIIAYITGYGIIRYTLDFLRVDGRNGFWFLSYAQWIVLGWLVFVVIFGGVYQLWHKRKYGRWFTEKN